MEDVLFGYVDPVRTLLEVPQGGCNALSLQEKRELVRRGCRMLLLEAMHRQIDSAPAVSVRLQFDLVFALIEDDIDSTVPGSWLPVARHHASHAIHKIDACAGGAFGLDTVLTLFIDTEDRLRDLC